MNKDNTSGVETLKSFIGELARPFAIYVTSAAAAAATVKIAWTIANKTDDFSAAAIFITAIFGGLAGLYGFKAWENRGNAKADSAVGVAVANGPQQAAAPPKSDPPADDGELPLSERIDP